MKYLLILLMLTSTAFAQKMSKADKITIANLKNYIGFLASDSLEGRRTGSRGEKIAADYIAAYFQHIGLIPAFEKEGYFQKFEVSDTKIILPETRVMVDDNTLILNKDYFPFSFSGETDVITDASISLRENGAAWFFDIGESLIQNQHNPHFDIDQEILQEVLSAKKRGAVSLIVYNSSKIQDSLHFKPNDKTADPGIPVVYFTSEGSAKYLADSLGMHNYSISIKTAREKRTGTNVAGYINNGAATTVIIGAHYDHLGYGEDNNSLYSGAEKMIHNGSDDNASGTAAMLELALRIKNATLKNNNYLFIAFSGEELGLFGSKYFTEHAPVEIGTINYMINMDMVGRLNDSSHQLTVGGYGTSPAWSELLSNTGKQIKIKIDSSGTGPSDHSSFYRKDIPVLFLFTGLHSDYHKPTDDAEKINYSGETAIIGLAYNTISRADELGKLAFLKTRETSMLSKSSFKVTLGIMPDYTYSGEGVRADGVSDGRPAQKAGLRGGDIILQLDDYACPDLEKYMAALGFFKKGDKATVKVLRNGQILLFDIVF